ncbi:hypothetical protein [Streptomyces erythrochromogenes]|uniref:hypothetical protein n=1 Tax=Streptomyces erythrochromogenes TaxID=285574 RepID=UPI0036BB5ACA
MSERIAELVHLRALARRFDAPGPEHIMLALHTVNDDGTAALDFYEQCVSGLLLAPAGRTDLLADAQTPATLLPTVKKWYALALTDSTGTSPAAGHRPHTVEPPGAPRQRLPRTSAVRRLPPDLGRRLTHEETADEYSFLYYSGRSGSGRPV